MGSPGSPLQRAVSVTVPEALGDERAFAERAERYRRELHVHCYRMLASFEEAEDAVQETLLRAWRGRDTFDGSSLFRAWLYRIATNVCVDLRRRSSRRITSLESFGEVSWLQPYPDRLLDEIAPSEAEPDTQVVERETIELAFLVALQVLPARQRAALIARDVLGWPATETATLLATSVAAANSALQRARTTLQAHLPRRRAEWSTPRVTAEEQALLGRFIDAHERCDAAAAVAIASEDLRITMPPDGLSFQGLTSIGHCSSGPSDPHATATGGWCPRAPIACRPRRPICADRATRSSARSSWTCCGSTAAGSRKLRRSGASCSPCSGSRRRWSGRATERRGLVPRQRRSGRAPNAPFVTDVTLLRERVESFERYPFTVPGVRALDTLQLHPKVTFFIGENGSGKSTLVEAIAVAAGFNAEGGTYNFGFATERTESTLHETLRLTRSMSRERDGYFLRAESFYNAATYIDQLDRESPGGSRLIDSYGGTSLHAQSHGESFLALAVHRWGGHGLYILDEPEAALSPMRQLSMLALIDDHVQHRGSQFIIATHSAILMAYPDAMLYELSVEHGIRSVAYEETEHFQITRDFLNDRQSFFRELFSDQENDEAR